MLLINNKMEQIGGTDECDNTISDGNIIENYMETNSDGAVESCRETGATISLINENEIVSENMHKCSN